MVQNVEDIKQKIITIIQRRGPSLPVHVAKETNLSMLFSAAFLSELVSEKAIKISHMKVGGSPVYLIPGQEYLLENFSQYLKSKEKDAYLLLKQKKFLNDKEQEPAIRVALRSIRDFAFPFRVGDEIYWRYFNVPESELKLKEIKELKKEKPKEEKKEKELKKKEEARLEKKPREPKIKEKPLLFFKEKPKTEPRQKKKISISHKGNERFFNKVKEFLIRNSYEISDIISFSKKDLVLSLQKDNKKMLAVAYNKKRITEADISNAYKKSLEFNVPYIVLGKGKPTKKIKEFLEASRNLLEIEEI